MYDKPEFFRLLPEESERLAFAELWPSEFYDAFHFFSSERSTEPFQRDPGEFQQLLADQRPRKPFSPPDPRDVNYAEAGGLLIAARCAWWRANGWPMTAAERAWREPRETPKTVSIARKEFMDGT